MYQAAASWGWPDILSLSPCDHTGRKPSITSLLCSEEAEVPVPQLASKQSRVEIKLRDTIITAVSLVQWHTWPRGTHFIHVTFNPHHAPEIAISGHCSSVKCH